MSMKKAIDQTIRDLKREVNKKVLKVPSIEQKVLDATSNEPWGPHGSLLADIAQATRNYHEYQMIMAVIWKRINDTGKNWRHVYKALTVLEYLVANGSERVIDEIREHAYQISTLSDFQYVDSSGRDQGNNVRRKSQSLVLLLNDKERIQEVRQKAASNRDKFRSTHTAGGMYRPGSPVYGDDRYGGREDERNGYGREREWGYRDGEKYGRYGDSYNHEGDRCGRDSDEHYGKGSYGDDDSRCRIQNVDDYQYGSRSRSSERNGECAYNDDDHHSSCGSSVRGQDHLQDGRPLERKFSEQNLVAPPSYEEAVGDSKTSTYSERDGETPAATVPQSSSPTAGSALQASAPTDTGFQSSSSAGGVNPSQETAEHGVLSHPNMRTAAFDEFDPRGSVEAAPSTSKNAEMDLFGSLSDVFTANPLAITPVSSGTADSEADAMKAASNPTVTAAISVTDDSNQSFDDPFGDSPFKAIPSHEPPAQTQNFGFMSSFQPAVSTSEHTEPAVQRVESPTSIGFTDALPNSKFNSIDASHAQTGRNPQSLPQEAQSTLDNDILAGILPLSGTPPTTSQPAFPASPNMPPATPAQAAFSATTNLPSATGSQTAFPSAMGSQIAFPASTGQPPLGAFMPQSGPTVPSFPHIPAQNMVALSVQHSHQSSLPYSSPPTAITPNVPQQAQSEATGQQNNKFLGDLLPRAGPPVLSASKSAPPNLAGSLVPQQPAKEKFETKSTVWTDTLSRGLVNLNISGPKTNPLADIGVDFESLNRKEKRLEKPSVAPATSNVSMGKAMGSGSGIGHAGAGVMRPPPNPMMGSSMGMGLGLGMGGRPSVGMGMANYGSMNQQPMGMGMGMGMGVVMGMGGMGMGMGGIGMGMNMGGMHMGMGQGMPMQQSNGLALGSNVGNYNPMMGRGSYQGYQ